MSKIVIKLGGQVFANQGLKALAQDLKHIQNLGHEIILVHGGGAQIDKALTEQGIVPQKKDGLRITDSATMQVVQQVLDGVNADLAEQFNAEGIKAQGMNSQNTVLQVKQASAIGFDGVEFDLGFVGNVEQVNVNAINALVAEGIVPLVAPLGVGGVHGTTLFNVNADNAASAIAEQLNADMLVFMSDVPGVLGADKFSVKKLKKVQCDHFTAQGTVSGGMLTKLHNAFQAAENGVKVVQIIDGTKPNALLESIQTPGNHGTLIAC
jgi:acetylglutamate kinase